MNLAAPVAAVAFACTALACGSVQEQVLHDAGGHDMDHPMPVVTAEHEWLQQLVGEWTVSCEFVMEPGAEPMQMESTESVRPVGDLWIVSEGTADFEGMPFTSVLTLGYDPARKAFVGTWIDTSQTHLWSYVGELDAARRVLTLNTRGPAFHDPSRMDNYRDRIELVAPGHKVLTSSVQGDDGTWTQFMRADFRRVD